MRFHFVLIAICAVVAVGLLPVSNAAAVKAQPPSVTFTVDHGGSNDCGHAPPHGGQPWASVPIRTRVWAMMETTGKMCRLQFTNAKQIWLAQAAGNVSMEQVNVGQPEAVYPQRTASPPLVVSTILTLLMELLPVTISG
eukprot:Nk52_evm10s251 gene=Nk52_evmTU10s251